MLQSRLDSEKKHMLKEHDREMDNYQKILFEKNDLESRCEMLERQLADLKVGNNRSTSNTSTLSKFIDKLETTLFKDMPEEVSFMRLQYLYS